MRRRLLLLPVSLLSLLSLHGCAKEGCLDPSDAECTVPSPCQDLEAVSCPNGSLEVVRVESMDQVPGGIDALGSLGDVRLANDRIVVIIDALDHPHYLAPTGGTLLDVSNVGADNDSMRHMFQATGVLPQEAANYTELRLIEEEGMVAVQVRGTLDSRPNVHVATRYELRPCEAGIRIRTELVTLEPDLSSVSVLDGSYFGDRELMNFTPGPNLGFKHPAFGLSTLGDATMGAAFMVGAGHSEPAASYGLVACDRKELWGFQSNNVAANGTQARPMAYGDWEVFERYVTVGEGPSVADAANPIFELRRQLFDELYVVIEGQVAVEGGEDRPIGEGLRASVHVAAGTAETPVEERVVWNHAEVEDDGTFRLAVPANDAYLLEVESYGRRGDPIAVVVEELNVDAGTLLVPPVGQVNLTGSVNGVPDYLQVYVLPADDATEEASRAAMFGAFAPCGPLLGAPYGSDPACNRVLVGPEGGRSFGVLPGRYDFFTTAGPFSTLSMQRDVLVEAGATVDVELAVETMSLLPPGSMSGDFHVHGGGSFDSNIPDETRVKAWMAARLDVLATTEHDSARDYAEARTRLAADDRLQVMVGTESTGHILWKILPDNPYPQVIGHWNLWPIPYDETAPWRGAPWDELVEPGNLFTRAVEQGWDPEIGVAQLNHPIEEALFARDQGWASALGIDGTMPLPTEFDGTPASSFLYTPPGSDFANSDYDTQEVMNGTENLSLLKYRAFWHYLLNQGIVRAGTANADSHTLTDNVVGSPRTVVFSGDSQADFDPVRFNRALKDGRALGTNGPLINAAISRAGGGQAEMGVAPFQPDEAGVLSMRVSAAPWVPIEEVRILVNGVEARVFGPGELNAPTDPFDDDGAIRLDVEVPLSELLPAGGVDAWIVVEAGRALVPQADLDCDGFPDTGDNNGDGTIDWQDVEGLEEDPDEVCLEEVGPILEPAAPERSSDAYLFWAVTPGGYPAAFTNPFILDRDGDGAFTGAGVAR